jgi:hypothetical protein
MSARIRLKCERRDGVSRVTESNCYSELREFFDALKGAPGIRTLILEAHENEHWTALKTWARL